MATWTGAIPMARAAVGRIRRAPAVPLFILGVLVLVALLSDFIAPFPPTEGSLPQSLMAPTWWQGGANAHPLGTDGLGRDILSRLIYGARISLSLGLLAIFFSGTVGAVVGIVSGYMGGRVDALLMRLTDIALSMPLILMAIILVAVLGASFGNIILVVVLLLWPKYARQVRAETLAIKEREHVALARVADCSALRIMWRHIFPNVVPTMLVLGTFQLGYVIILESSLSFLGVGLPPPAPAWGSMVADGRGVLDTAWWIWLWPALAISLTVLSVNLIGDWLRDRLDPKLRQI